MMHPRLRVRLLIGLVAAGLFSLAACSVFQPELEEPEFRLERVTVLALGLSEQRFRLTLEVDNPNRQSLQVREIRYAVTLGGLDFAEGESTEGFRLAGEDTTTVDLEARTQLLGSLPELSRMAYSGQRSFDYTLGGEVKYGRFFRGTRAFDRTGSVRLLLD
ncbi:LEA type 2 family protein [Aquisalimonas sp. 2447]|uniref:LEA type 2 family protein n=1 Tax=Aquisalimonas sp. 2447 TaxID=2740807 RepID=UPI0014323379|nr:LEA type 2 family protein [Aquisalimonas sp. 2447]QIT56607.1 LEA type 2 family protein [Aquisalimonas sp. 2447]